MEKNIKITTCLLLVIISIIGIIIVNNNNTGKKTFKKDGILYALTVDGTSKTSFPSKGLYKATVTCENADGKWLYDDWKLSIENITGNVSCDVDFTTIEKTYLNNYVTKLEESTSSQTEWQVVNENGYRYEGKNPNNYVWFNNEYWRIIGVFDTEVVKTDNTTENKSLVKIIRAETLDGLAWDKSSTNNWTAASLKSLLNESYYNAQDGTSSGYCYGYGATVTGNCDYTKKGIQSAYRRMIAEVTWYLGGSSTAVATAAAFYGYERGTTVYSGRSTSTTGYIGLMYPSDYGYSFLSSSCERTTNLSSPSLECAGASWLYGKGYEWTLSPHSSYSSNVFSLSYGGSLNATSNAYYGYGVRPVLYLNSSVYKIDGDGTLNSPYIIGM